MAGEFDIATGCSLFDPDTKLMSYPVHVENGRILVEIGGKRKLMARYPQAILVSCEIPWGENEKPA